MTPATHPDVYDAELAQCPNCDSFAWYVYETCEHGAVGHCRCADCNGTFYKSIDVEATLPLAGAWEDEDDAN